MPHVLQRCAEVAHVEDILPLDEEAEEAADVEAQAEDCGRLDDEVEGAGAEESAGDVAAVSGKQAGAEVKVELRGTHLQIATQQEVGIQGLAVLGEGEDVVDADFAHRIQRIGDGTQGELDVEAGDGAGDDVLEAQRDSRLGIIIDRRGNVVDSDATCEGEREAECIRLLDRHGSLYGSHRLDGRDRCGNLDLVDCVDDDVVTALAYRSAGALGGSLSLDWSRLFNSLDRGCGLGIINRLKAENDKIRERIKTLLTENRVPVDYMEVRYKCPLCKDTGMTDEGIRCQCYIEREKEAAQWQK